MADAMFQDGSGFPRLAALAGAFALALAAVAGVAQAQTPTSAQPADPAGKPPPSPPPDAKLPQVEPVIPDKEFEQAIPPLKAEGESKLAQPLESVEEFEQQMKEQQPDAELSQPLPPLEQFNPEAAAVAGKGQGEELPEVAYKVEVTGLDKADQQSGTDLRRMFDEFSALHHGRGKAANTAMVLARLHEDAELLKRILASQGWFSARVTAGINRAAGTGGPLTARLAVSPGRRYSLSKVVVDAQPTVPPDLIHDNLPLQVGQPIIADRVLAAEAQVGVALPQNGYPFAKVGARDILLDRRTGEGVYTLPVDVGPRARFGNVAIEGDLAFDAKHAELLARFRRGQLYDSRKVDDWRKELMATGLFSSISVKPQPSGKSAGDGTEYVTMMVKQKAGPKRTIAGTAGYGTGEGFRIQGSWTNRNMFPPEGALIVSGVAGTAEQSASVTFRRSNAGRRDRTFNLVLEAQHSQLDAYSAYTGRLAATISYDSTPLWQKRLTHSLGVELLASSEKDYDFAAGQRRRRTYYIAGLSGQVGIDHSNDLLNPTKGYRLKALVQPEGSVDGGFHPYVRVRVDASGYLPLGKSLVAAGRVRLGTIQGVARADIAPSRRFYAGGGGSVRGYSYKSLGPQDPNGNPIGGRSLNEASAELRYRFGEFGVVGFVDAGQSYAQTLPQFSDLRFGAGIGGRFYTNFGPIRIDLATPLDRRPGESRINVYVSIGQAF